MRALISVLVAVLLAGLVGGCNNIPTLPAPPPMQDRFYSLEPPDVDGYVEVVGEAGAFPTWDMDVDRVYGIVLNLTTHRGVIEPVAMDGSYYARIEASSGETLAVYSRMPDGTESLPIYMDVP